MPFGTGLPKICKGSARGGRSGTPLVQRSALLQSAREITSRVLFSRPPPQWGGLGLDSRSSGCARLGGGVGPPLKVVVEKVAVLVVLARRHRHAVRAAVRRAVDDENSSAIKEETGPAAVRRVSPCLLNARPVHALGAPGIIVVANFLIAIMIAIIWLHGLDWTT